MDLHNTADKALLVLADGTIARGEAIGHRGTTGGELCFNTSMTGYQEIMSDPSYVGQIMMMTYPHIGNYGTSDEDMEADGPQVAGFVVRAFSNEHSNPRAREDLDSFMKRHELVGITGVDTRKLVTHIRAQGVINAVISSENLNEEELLQKAKEWPSMSGLALADKVSTKEPYTFAEGDDCRIAVLDYGVKRTILKRFASRGCTVRVFPGDAAPEEVLAWSPDGLFLSNGPGDPRAMTTAIEQTRELLFAGLPVMGICMGHQLMSLACGIDVYKMHVGHRGANQPVRNEEKGTVEVTTQNHGFAVDADSVTDDLAEISHINLNDGSVEGLRFKQFEGISLQYHPEASPGPHDSFYLFDEFLEMVRVDGEKSKIKAG